MGRPVLRVSSFLAPHLLPAYRAVAASIGRVLGMPVEVRGEGSYAAYRAGEPDVSFICSLAYVILEERGEVPAVPVAAPVIQGHRYGGRPVYFSDVVVRRDDPAGSFADLRGRVWAFNEPWSQSGCGVARHHLAQMGEGAGFFGEVVEAGSHDRALAMISDGRADAAAIDSHLLGVLARDDPARAAGLKVIDVLGPSTIQPVTVAARIAGPVREAIRDALLGAHLDPGCRAALDDGMIERFVAVDPGDYDDVRRMAAACRESGLDALC